MKEAARADESATRGISPPGAPPTSSSTVTIRRRPNTQALPYFFLPVIYAHESLEDVPRAAGDGRGSVQRNESAWERFMRRR